MSLALSSQSPAQATDPRCRVLLYGDNRRALLQRLYKWQRQQRINSQQIDITFLRPQDAWPDISALEKASHRHYQLMICQHSIHDAFDSLLALALEQASEALFLRVAPPLANSGERDNVTAWQSAREPAQTDRQPTRSQHVQASALHYPG